MSKKDFKTAVSTTIKPAQEARGVEALISEVKDAKRPVGRPRTSSKDPEATPWTERGTREGDTRATFIINKKLVEKLRALAYWDRTTQKEIIEGALDVFFTAYERDYGSIKPLPK